MKCYECGRYMDDCDGSGKNIELSELRHNWEYDADFKTEIPDYPECFMVIVGRNHPIEGHVCGCKHEGKCFTTKFSLYRYFTIGGKWEVSADVSDKGPQAIFDALSKYKFTSIIPE